MATLHVAFTRVVERAGGVSGIPAAAPYSAEALTTSTTSAATTATAPDILSGAIVAVVCGDAAHYVVAGSAPVASATAGYRVPANVPYSIEVKPGDKVAAVTLA